MDVMTELRPAGELFKSGNYQAGLRVVSDVWDRIPEPKTSVNDAFMVIEYAVTFALKMGDLDEAWKWASMAPAFRQKRLDGGEVEFLVGRVAFERGELEVARENLLVAEQKSGGRMFRGEDPKYLALISG